MQLQARVASRAQGSPRGLSRKNVSFASRAQMVQLQQIAEAASASVASASPPGSRGGKMGGKPASPPLGGVRPGLRRSQSDSSFTESVLARREGTMVSCDPTAMMLAVAAFRDGARANAFPNSRSDQPGTAGRSPLGPRALTPRAPGR